MSKLIVHNTCLLTILVTLSYISSCQSHFGQKTIEKYQRNNPVGNLDNSVALNVQNNVKERMIFKYLVQSLKNGDEELNFKKIRKEVYDTLGRVIEKFHFNADSLISRELYTYIQNNNDNELLRWERYNASDEIISREQIIISENDTVFIALTGPSGSTDNIYEYEYYDNGLIKSETRKIPGFDTKDKFKGYYLYSITKMEYFYRE